MNEEHYLRLLSVQLNGFKKTGGTSFNFKCPYCESNRKGKKQRGYVYLREGNWLFFCHNCLKGQLFKNFLKSQNESLYQDYMLDNFGRKDSSKPVVPKNEKSNFNQTIDKLRKVSSLNPFHVAKEYVVSRQIPTQYHRILRHTDKFKALTNSMIQGKFASSVHDEPRLVIPMYKNERLIGFQGRAYSDEGVRYITISLEEGTPVVWGYDSVEWNAKHYVFEGVMDAMMVPNAIAVCGSRLLTTMQELNKPKNYSILCFDNEPRNTNIVSSMKKAIKAGYPIFIPPGTMNPHKDVNKWVLSNLGVDPPFEFVHTEKVRQLGYEFKMLVDQNTFRGLNAELRLAEWAKT